MLHNRRVGGGHAVAVYRHPLLASITSVLGVLAAVRDPSPRRVRWTPLLAGVTAVLMALDAGCTATTRLTDALRCLGTVFKGRRRTPQTYNGLLKALCRQFHRCFPVLKADLQRQVREVIQRVRPVRGWIILAVDGSKEDLPRTRSNTRTFGIADNGGFPQAFLTSIISVTTGLLWDWRVGKGRASEKDHLRAMINGLPTNTLLLGDGNFVGWPIWSALCARKTDFLIRVGGNVDLLADLLSGRSVSVWRASQLVYLWPRDRRADHPPLKLRLIRIKGKKGSVFLLTNVLDARRMSVRCAGMIYRQRWEIEVFYRTFKRTLGAAKLKSASGPRARVELNWALVTLTVVGLLALPAILTRRLRAGRFSPAEALRVLRQAMLGRTSRHGSSAKAELTRRLSRAIRDRYTRTSSKQSRHRVTTRNTPKTRRHRPPILVRASPVIRTLALQKLGLQPA